MNALMVTDAWSLAGSCAGFVAVMPAQRTVTAHGTVGAAIADGDADSADARDGDEQAESDAGHVDDAD